MDTGASINAADLHANWIGQEVQITDTNGIVTLTGTLDKFSIGLQEPTRDPRGNPVILGGVNRFAVKVWVAGHKMQIPGDHNVAIADGGVPVGLPAR